jgi:uncharacterized Zn-finger protein
MEPGLNTDFEHPSKIFINLGTLPGLNTDFEHPSKIFINLGTL